MTLIIITYLIGCVIAFGNTTWLQYMVDAPAIRNLQPTYQKPWHSKTILVMTTLSWLGVILAVYVSLTFHRKVNLKYSFQPLWDAWAVLNSRL